VTSEPDRVSVVGYFDADGDPITETLWAVPVSQGRYRLVRSPLIASGLAAGDVFEVDGNPPHARVIERAGNIAVQVWAKQGLTMDDVYELRELAAPAGGTLDGHNTGFAAYTFPVKAGFHVVARILEDFVTRHPQYSWTYGNVYDEDDEPLNWWIHSSS
jgi:hypothetical protein